MQRKICALDIDGVLNYYPNCWIGYVNKVGGFRFNNLNDMRNILSYAEYVRFKDMYRSGDFKASLEPRVAVSEFTRLLKFSGYDIIIITSRPFEQYPHLRMLTHNWLRDNGIIYDDLFNSQKKHLDIFRFYPELEFMVEDNRMFANNISELGYKVFLMNNDYNIGETNKNVVRIDLLDEILKYLREA